MWLVQIFVPVVDDSDQVLRDVKQELIDRFGGVTAYSRSPAEGIWREGNTKEKDDIIIVEVMANEFDRDWWQAFRSRLERQLAQKEIVVRAQRVERL